MKHINDIAFWLAVLVLIAMFIAGLAEAHENHLGDLTTQTNVTISGCQAGTYLADTAETGCFLIYKEAHGLGNIRLHYTPVPRDPDGECRCPTTNKEGE
jgi:hypothetical protein